MSANVVKEKSFAFALQAVKLSRYLQEDQREYVLSRQFLRSGTAIGALVREAEHAESKPDFIHKMSIALKEANETVYWIELLTGSDLIPLHGFDTLCLNAIERVKLLTAIINTAKTRPDRWKWNE